MLLPLWGLFVFGLLAWHGHPLEDTDSSNPELDNYCGQAHEIASGRIPRDVFHPLLFQALGAGLHLLGIPVFRACQTVSVLSGGLFIMLTWLVARRFCSRFYSLLVALMVLAITTTWIASIRAASDMLFHCLALSSLLFCLKLLDENQRSLSTFLLAGTVIGAATSTRYQGAQLAIPLLLAVLLDRKNLRVAGILLAIAGCFLSGTPQMLVNRYHFGNPFHQENWRNVVAHWSVLGGMPFSKKVNEATPEEFDTLVEDFLRHPIERLSRQAGRIEQGILFDFPRALGGTSLGGMFLCFLFLMAMVNGFSHPRKGRPLLFVFAIVVGPFTLLFFPPNSRLLVSVFPVVLAGAFADLSRQIPGSGVRRSVLAILLVSFWMGQLETGRNYLLLSTRDDLESAAFIAQARPDATVLGTTRLLGNHVDFRYLPIDVLGPGGRTWRLCEGIFGALLEHRPDFVLVNTRMAFDFPAPPVLASAPNETFPFLLPAARFGESRVYRVDYDHQFFQNAGPSSGPEFIVHWAAGSSTVDLSWRTFIPRRRNRWKRP